MFYIWTTPANLKIQLKSANSCQPNNFVRNFKKLALDFDYSNNFVRAKNKNKWRLIIASAVRRAKKEGRRGGEDDVGILRYTIRARGPTLAPRMARDSCQPHAWIM